MDLKLVSRDRELYKLCCEILAELHGQEWTVTVVDPENCNGDAHLYIWDFQPNTEFPECLDGNSARYLFLVSRKDLTDFRNRVREADAGILLKPVTRPTLAAFLGMATSSQGDRIDPTANSLRADRDEILQCLLQTNLKLQEYDQDRTNFLARAVHDFRAPLTALSGYCGLLLGEPLGNLNDSQKEVLRRMQNSVRRLSRMASAMFRLSVGRQVRRELDPQPGSIHECLEQAMYEIGPLAEKKRIAITASLEPGTNLYFEAGQIEQVLVNILENACKFTRKAGYIEIKGYPFFWERRKINSAIPGAERRRQNSTEPNSYRVDIVDSGESIPEEHLAGIFEEYTSYAGGRDRSGGGLGLAICKMIINQHEGRVWAENTEAGPMFSFVLPMCDSEIAQTVETVETTA